MAKGPALTYTEVLQEAIDTYHRHYEANKLWEQTRWLGQPMWKLPADAIVLQEIIFETRPEIIIETGTGMGGSALFYASIQQLLDHGSVLTIAFNTLGAIAMHGFRLSQPMLGETVGVIGLGLLGLLTAGIARAAGRHVFGVDLDGTRVALAKQLGISAVLRLQAVEAGLPFTHGQGFDHVLICADTSSSDPVELAGEIEEHHAQHDEQITREELHLCSGQPGKRVAADQCVSQCAQYAAYPQYQAQCESVCATQNPAGADKLRLVYQCAKTSRYAKFRLPGAPGVSADG